MSTCVVFFIVTLVFAVGLSVIKIAAILNIVTMKIFKFTYINVKLVECFGSLGWVKREQVLKQDAGSLNFAFVICNFQDFKSLNFQQFYRL